MKNNRHKKSLIMSATVQLQIFLVALATIASAQYVPPTLVGVSTERLRELAQRRSGPAIIALGMRNDPSSIPLLKQLAAADDASDSVGCPEHMDSANIAECRMNHRLGRWSAKAALTRMHVEDHFGEFVVQLSTSDFLWKQAMVDLLGYIGDRRAISVLGPMLFDESQLPGRGSTFFVPMHRRVATALGSILQPSFMSDRHRPYGEFYIPQWRQWWIDHRAEYGDNSPLPSGSTSAGSQLTILKDTVVKENSTATTDSGSVGVQLESVQVQLPSSDGRMTTASVLLALAPQNGPLWWKYHIMSSSGTNSDISNFVAEYKLYLTSTSLLGFQLAGNRLIISAGSAPYASLDTALSAVVPLMQRKLTSGDTTPVITTRSADLWRVLGQGFFLSGGRVGNGSIGSVVRQNAQWVLSLIGPNKDTATITLGSDYKVINATLNGKAVYP